MVDVMRRRIQGRRRRGERQCSAPLRLRRQFHLPECAGDSDAVLLVRGGHVRTLAVDQPADIGVLKV
jgi:hypothetical protein